MVGTNIVRSARDFSRGLRAADAVARLRKEDGVRRQAEARRSSRAPFTATSPASATDFNRFIRFDERDLLSNTNEVMLSVDQPHLCQARRQRAGDLHLGADAEALLRPDVRRRAADRGAQRLPGDRRHDGLRVPGGPAQHSPVVSKLRTNPIGGLGVQWQADYDPRFGARGRQQFLRGLPLEQVLRQRRTQRSAQQSGAARALRPTSSPAASTTATPIGAASMQVSTRYTTIASSYSSTPPRR